MVQILTEVMVRGLMVVVVALAVAVQMKMVLAGLEHLVKDMLVELHPLPKIMVLVEVAVLAVLVLAQQEVILQEMVELVFNLL